MFFEAMHSLYENEFTIRRGDMGLTYPKHIHRSFEYFEQVAGSTEICISGCRYVLSVGDAVLIFPLQSHSYRMIEEGEIKVCIFSPDMVAKFYSKYKNKLPQNHKFKCTIDSSHVSDNIFHKKALLYFVCGEFDNGRKYVENTLKNQDQLLVSLLYYASDNFSGSCLLRDAALKVGYDYAYVSKFFKKRVGISFRQYVNGIRIVESKKLLLSTLDSIEEIATKSGFNSLRTFDREFRAQTKMTPSEYRAQSSRE